MPEFNYLTIERQASDEVIELLEQNRIGTPGESMVYQHKDVRAKIESVPDPYFANLSIRRRLYGTICFSRRSTYSNGENHEAYYLRYFTFREKMRSGIERKTGRASQNKIAAEVHQLMSGDGLDATKDALLYAYVDPENVRSRRLIEEFGFSRKGDFRAIPFSRINPKTDPMVERLDQDELKQMRKMLLDSYKHQRLVFFDYLEQRGTYYVLREKDQIICGVQAIEDGWEILDLPGMKGAVMMHLVPRLPLMGRLFNPDYRFVFFEHIFCLPGKEALLERLFESVLAAHNLHSAVICLDPRSQQYTAVQKTRLGLTHRIMGEKEIEIYLKSNNPSFEAPESSYFISGFDVL